ncbi:MAG: efflux RND transporter periplasmic adaptor subunit [Gammaproteobacteria bacterium]|nr:efflux RND transporter periplasmic adaptor subunit [Gammaproteobacteria bacterium]
MNNLQKLICLILFVSIGLIACQKNDSKQAKVPKLVEVSKITDANLVKARRFTGLVAAAKITKLSFEEAGTINYFPLLVGKRVKKGELLGKLDDEPYLLLVRLREQQLNKAKAVEQEKEITYIAQKQMLAKKHISKIAFKGIESAYQAAQQDVKAATTQLKIAKRSLHNTRLFAPFSGVIVKTFVRKHMFVGAGTVVAELHGYEKYEVSVDLPDTYINSVHVGDKAIVTVFALSGHKPISGVVSEVGQQGLAGLVFSAVVSLEKIDAPLKSGLSAEVTFLKSKSSSLAHHFYVPLSSVIARKHDLQAMVFVYNKEHGVVQKRSVTVLHTDGKYAEISGLKLGDVIVVSGSSYLTDNEKVRVKFL